MNLMILLCILAAGFSVMVFVRALRHANEGHEDVLGYHSDEKDAAPRSKGRSTKKRRSSASRARFNTHHAAGA